VASSWDQNAKCMLVTDLTQSRQVFLESKVVQKFSETSDPTAN